MSKNATKAPRLSAVWTYQSESTMAAIQPFAKPTSSRI